MEAGVNDAADDPGDLDIHAVIVQVPPHGVNRLFRLYATVHCNEVVRHEEEAGRRVGDQPVQQFRASQAVNALHQVRETGAVHRIDTAQQCPGGGANAVIGMRFQCLNGPRHGLEHVLVVHVPHFVNWIAVGHARPAE